jgi:hypothetical protein
MRDRDLERFLSGNGGTGGVVKAGVTAWGFPVHRSPTLARFARHWFPVPTEAQRPIGVDLVCAAAGVLECGTNADGLVLRSPGEQGSHAQWQERSRSTSVATLEVAPAEQRSPPLAPGAALRLASQQRDQHPTAAARTAVERRREGSRIVNKIQCRPGLEHGTYGLTGRGCKG